MARKKSLREKAMETFDAPSGGDVALAVAGSVPLSRPSAKTSPRPSRIANVRIFDDQLSALQDEAHRRYLERGRRGKPDASEVLRELLDDCLEVWLSGSKEREDGD